MKTVFAIFFLVIGSLQAQDKAIAWSDTYKLVWSDFKGPIDQNSGAVAITSSGITFGYSLQMSGNTVVSFTTDVSTHFYPDKSWYKPDEVDDNVLAHEQLHFNITELFARKFRKEISALKISNDIKDELKKLNEDINKELAKMQNQFDAETNYSINKEEQLQWQTFVQQELNRLKHYKYELYNKL